MRTINHYHAFCVTNKRNIIQPPRQFVARYYSNELNKYITDIITFDKVLDFANNINLYIYHNREQYVCVDVFFYEKSDEKGKYIRINFPNKNIPVKEFFDECLTRLKHYKRVEHVQIYPGLTFDCYYELF